MTLNFKEILGLNSDPATTRLVVAMSGGVDSSVTAALLKEAGYDVVGLTMRLYDQGEIIERKKACCAGQDIYDAQQVADKIGIPHYILDYETLFKQSVMDDFADSYMRGETPIPCVKCNQTVKFKDMLGMARELGGVALVTGHYIRWAPGPQMHRAVDPGKDQSYFLFHTTPEQLAFLRFPLGGLRKEETRAHARRLGLEVSDKPDSQDICFVPNGDYAAMVQKLRPGALDAGNLIHAPTGHVLGRHDGIIHFTIGQRRGIGVSSPTGEPLYVIRLNPETKDVFLGPKEALAVTTLILRDLNWLGDGALEESARPLQVKFRSVQSPVNAFVSLTPEGQATVRFAEPQYGVSPGQACVFYDNSRVLGGGFIAGTAG